MNDLLSMHQLTDTDIMRLIKRALEMKAGKYTPYKETKYIANLFFEPSTRTKASFEMAEKRLGITSIPFDVDHSSVTKGESLYDTCRTMEAIGCEALVIRHGITQYYDEMEALGIPIINGGDGSGSHPTQSLLDLMTIYEKFGRFDGLKVLIAGDISHSRVAKSNQQALSKLGAEVRFCAPEAWQDDSIAVPYVNLDDAVGEADVVMLLRVQHERHGDTVDFTKKSYHMNYGMTLSRHQHMKENAIIMHPAPVNRDVEIDGRLIEGPRSVIFEQMNNGVFMRMSVLQEIFGSEE
ncbi:aspartate carbamoyltransferase catalytic subunit [Salinicoccus sesuvii]|uniref:Aspartate carbamoyltransferase n=1 Tax=Salinicoccus sesuvii TaxID=868281 RepID=A0ABV7N5L1_9STAP